MKIPYKAVLLSPYLLVVLGSIMNQVAVSVNGGQMPVLFPLHNCSLLGPDDPAHSCMTTATHLKFLCDWILGSQSVSSIGDFLLEVGNDIKTPSLIVWLCLVVKQAWLKRV